jgi:hypothetical protein
LIDILRYTFGAFNRGVDLLENSMIDFKLINNPAFPSILWTEDKQVWSYRGNRTNCHAAGTEV